MLPPTKIALPRTPKERWLFLLFAFSSLHHIRESRPESSPARMSSDTSVAASVTSNSPFSNNSSSAASSDETSPVVECEAYLPIESALVRSLLVASHVATLGALYASARVIYDRVQVAHPVFAVVFQARDATNISYLCTNTTS